MSGYIGPIPVPQGIQNKESFTATAAQTTFNTNGYTDGAFISVYLNGVRLVNGTDYTATNGSDVVLASAANTGDVLDFESFNSFSLVSQIFDNLTTKNPTHEDTDGGRESALSFQGEQSGGEISTLAAIQASHDGTADDQKGDLIFKTNDGSDNNAPTEAMRIDSAQNVGIGTVSPASLLHVDSDNNFGNILLSRDGGAGGRRPFGIGITGAADNDLTISASADTDQAGAFEGDRKEIVRFLAGGGMTFNGDTAAANALSDYEEGTWTPEFTDSTNDLSLSNGSESNGGFYTKIGNMVVASFGIYNVSISSLSGTLLIKTLPFTFKTTGLTAGIMHIAGTSGGSNVPIIMYPVASSAIVILYKAVSSTQNLASLGTTDLSSNVSVRMNLTYFTDA